MFLFSAFHFCFEHFLFSEVGLKLFHINENWVFLTVFCVKSNSGYYKIVISSFEDWTCGDNGREMGMNSPLWDHFTHFVPDTHENCRKLQHNKIHYATRHMTIPSVGCSNVDSFAAVNRLNSACLILLSVQWYM